MFAGVEKKMRLILFTIIMLMIFLGGSSFFFIYSMEGEWDIWVTLTNYPLFLSLLALLKFRSICKRLGL